MMKGCANASRKVRAFAERRRGYKVCCFFRLVTKRGEQIAAFDGVGGVLGRSEQFGEFRPVGAAGEEGVDKRGREDAEPLQALLFLEGLVVSGLLFGEVGVALLVVGRGERRFRLAVCSQNGVFGSCRTAFSSRRALALSFAGQTSGLSSTAPHCGTGRPLSFHSSASAYGNDRPFCSYGWSLLWPRPAPREADRYMTDQR